jgi:hypothetical protein
MKRQPIIRCPACEWRPTPEARWECVPSCATIFHTFWTGGVCPGCGWKWEKTQCLACGTLSPHKAWYREPDEAGDEGEDESFEREREKEHSTV